jgi:N-acetylmuramoyl-L-alanine amidase
MQDLPAETSGSFMENLYVGSSGEDVKKLQQKLKELDFYHKEIDGLFGQGVEQAVKEFQDSQGFAIDGVAGKSTKVALGLMTVEPESAEEAESAE